MYFSWLLTNYVKADVVKTQVHRFIYSQFLEQPLKIYISKRGFGFYTKTLESQDVFYSGACWQGR